MTATKVGHWMCVQVLSRKQMEPWSYCWSEPEGECGEVLPGALRLAEGLP